MSSADEIDLDPALARAITPSEGPSSVTGATAIDGSGSVTASHAIAERLATGALDPAAAQQLLIDQVLTEQLPDVAPEQLERIRGELATLLAHDPTLAALLRP